MRISYKVGHPRKSNLKPKTLNMNNALGNKIIKTYSCPWEECPYSFRDKRLLKLHVESHLMMDRDRGALERQAVLGIPEIIVIDSPERIRSLPPPLPPLELPFEDFIERRSPPRVAELEEEIVAPAEPQSPKEAEKELKKPDPDDSTDDQGIVPEEFPFQCLEIGCGRKYKFYELLYEHVKKHEGKLKPFICRIDHCGKRYKTQKNLDIHKETHTKNLYVCICGKTYARKGLLDHHLRKTRHRIPMATVVEDS